MSDPILDLLATPPNPSMSVDEPAVYAGGRRRLRRRRLLTAAGAAAAALAIAGTIGVLAPRVNDDALPALPTPTVTPTPDATPTITSSGTPSVTVTSSASVTATPTPASSATKVPSSTPNRTTASSTPTTATGTGWSDSVTVAGRTYRARLVPSPGGEHNYDLQLQSGGTMAFTPTSVYNTEGRWGLEEANPRVAFYLSGSPLSDLISIKGEPVDDEVIRHITVPAPDGDDIAGEPYVDLHVTIFRTTSANSWAPYGPEGWVVQVPGGGTWDLSQE
jgi:hypothetical protein